MARFFYAAILVFGFALLALCWVYYGELAGFFLILGMVCLMLLRWRVPRLKWTIIADFVLSVVIYPQGLPVVVVIVVASVFFWLCEAERVRGLKLRDTEAGRVYKLEALQRDLLAATARIEIMTAVSERARIAREIHDNAGHEIVAAYISLQALRGELSGENENMLRLYDAALSRLDAGANKIRDAVHNLAPVSAIGADSLREICERFPSAVDFRIFGNTAHVPVHAWNVLEACLNETLTNAAKHAPGALITVNLDATLHIIRLCVENESTSDTRRLIGTGLRNLRHRAATIGGNFSANFSDGRFRAVCVVPISKKEGNLQ